MNKTDKIFEILDEIIVDFIGKEHAERRLTATYFEFWTTLKEQVGTASGFTGLSEYLFFWYILKYIENELNLEFHPHKETPDTFSFRSKEVAMTHDIEISKFIDVKNQKTDIAIFTIVNNDYKLIAAFQLKIYISSPYVLQNDLLKLEDLGEKTSALLFEILFKKPTKAGKKQLLEFCNKGKYRGRAFVISKYDLGCNINLNDAIDMTIKIIEDVIGEEKKTKSKRGRLVYREF